jgi:hypothetical protein
MDSFLEEIKRQVAKFSMLCALLHHPFREQAMREARYSRSSYGRSVTALAGEFSSALTAIKLNCVALQL